MLKNTKLERLEKRLTDLEASNRALVDSYLKQVTKICDLEQQLDKGISLRYGTSRISVCGQDQGFPQVRISTIVHRILKHLDLKIERTPETAAEINLISSKPKPKTRKR